MLSIDQEAALAAIPSMLPDSPDTRQKAFDLIRQVLAARGEFSAGDHERLERIAGLFGADEQLSVVPNLALANENPVQAKAS